jgi:hypothetical protein
MLTASNSHNHLNSFKTWLKQCFDLMDMGPARYFLGTHIMHDREKRTLSVSQKMYLEKILKHAKMSQCNLVGMPMTPGVAL